jgi:hypothetical protein
MTREEIQALHTQDLLEEKIMRESDSLWHEVLCDTINIPRLREIEARLVTLIPQVKNHGFIIFELKTHLSWVRIEIKERTEEGET